MSFRRALWAFAVVMCLAAPIAVQAQGDYLDVFVVKVKPEKLADFQALTKKWADANRRNNGDRWLALEAVYGEGNVYQFTSTRKDYADIDKANEAVMAAVNKAFGKAAAVGTSAARPLRTPRLTPNSLANPASCVPPPCTFVRATSPTSRLSLRKLSRLAKRTLIPSRYLFPRSSKAPKAPPSTCPRCAPRWPASTTIPPCATSSATRVSKNSSK